MTRLPIIAAFGGYNAAGRSSFHQAYERTIFSSLSEQEQRQHCLALGRLMRSVNCEAGRWHWADAMIVDGGDAVGMPT